jgi:hypothetical protein
MPVGLYVPPSGIESAFVAGRMCVVWANEYPDELGFRVSLRYDGGERFEHLVDPDSHDFVFPPTEQPILSGPGCFARHVWTLEVFVLLPSGAEPVGATSVIAECRSAE